jgi:uncharacterized repeat protein (TIGR03803 family)
MFTIQGAVRAALPVIALAVVAAAPSAPARALPLVRILHIFQQFTPANDGYSPGDGLVEGPDGWYYGTTNGGGTHNEGTVFRVSPSGDESVVYSFGAKYTDGTYPAANLCLGADGYFYGTTSRGGATNGQGIDEKGYGTVFKVSTSGNESVIHSFGDGTVVNDGLYPSSGLIEDTSHVLHGATGYGGSADCGTVFQMTTTGDENIQHSFGDGSVADDGSWPSGVIQATDGNFYGIATYGGNQGAGALFRIATDGTVTTIHSFGAVAYDGTYPAALIQGADTNLYGVTSQGGATWVGSNPGGGTAFRMTLAGDYGVVHSFGKGVVHDGTNPSGITQGADGNLYGTTVSGGSSGWGTVFKMTTAGSESVEHSFYVGAGTTDGAEPWGGVIQGSDGNFYGTTLYGGTSPYADAGVGTAYVMIEPASVLSVTLAEAQIAQGKTTTGTVTISTAAPAGGVTVKLKSSSTSAATVPASVTVGNGETSAEFKVKAAASIAADVTTSITATLSSSSRSATLTVDPASILSLTVKPGKASGVATLTGTIGLLGKADPPFVVNLASSDPAIVAVPASVTVPTGESTATFAIVTTAPAKTTKVTITATAGDLKLTATVTVSP